ncbi:hypothetical protein OH747_41370 (plasmid) [Streptomyces anthocyanicus]|nr:hypothetical protein OH747_41370 [Streptomyces anthocyanicus]
MIVLTDIRCTDVPRGRLRELPTEHASDLVELSTDRDGVGLGEDRADGGCDHIFLDPFENTLEVFRRK